MGVGVYRTFGNGRLAGRPINEARTDEGRDRVTVHGQVRMNAGTYPFRAKARPHCSDTSSMRTFYEHCTKSVNGDIWLAIEVPVSETHFEAHSTFPASCSSPNERYSSLTVSTSLRTIMGQALSEIFPPQEKWSQSQIPDRTGKVAIVTVSHARFSRNVA